MMNKFIAKIFKSAGVDAKVSKDPKNPKFKVQENKLTLEGYVRNNRYIMEIKDNAGKKIDSISVSIDNSNDIVNRINESLNTLKMLSKAYDNKKLVEDDEEFDTVLADDDEAETLYDGLEDLYNAILDVAEKAESLLDLCAEGDAEQMNEIIGMCSSLYDVACDVEDYREDITPEDDVQEESVRHKRISKCDIDNCVNYLSMSESILRRSKSRSDILTAIKDIKSELVLRGR